MVYDLIIIGAGASGISSAIYAGSRRMNLLLLEQNEVGGLINKVSVISHFEGVNLGEPGRAFIDRAKKQLAEEGISVVKERVIKVDLTADVKRVCTEERCYEGKTVIIAGGSVPNKVPFEGLQELENKHVFYEVIDERLPRLKDKEIFVVGGSDGAVKEAIYLSGYAKTVNLVFIEDKIACVKEFQEKLSALKNVKLHAHSSIVKAQLEGETLAVDIKDNTSGAVKTVRSQDGKIFVFAGIKPASALYQGVIEMENGFIKTDCDMQTNVKNVFAVGDIRAKKVRQVSLAVAEGTIAAIMASKAL